ncbi:MAG: hypothetical protein JST35_00250 [Armatimonadetes bacterium]|nr:hypothetical protein [Armatimonadota bacterium]
MNLNCRPLQKIQISRYGHSHFKDGHYLFHNEEIPVSLHPPSMKGDHRVQFLKMEDIESVVAYPETLEDVDLDELIGGYNLKKKTEWPDVVERVCELGVPTTIITTERTNYNGVFVSADSEECVFAIYKCSAMAYEGDLFIRTDDVVQMTVGLAYASHILWAMSTRRS